MSTVNFNDGIFAQEALTAFVTALTPLSIFSHSYSAETIAKGNAVYVPRIDALTATTFSYLSNNNMPYENTGGTINTITVNLSEQFIQGVDFTDQQFANSSAIDYAQLGALQGATLGKTVVQRVMSLFTTANFGAAALNLPIASFSRASTVSLRGIMAKRDVDPRKCSLLVNEDLMTSLLSDATIYQTYSSNANVVQDGNINALAGMRLIDTNLLPTNGISLAGICAFPDSIALAMRYLAPQDGGPYAEVRRVVDPVSGVVMGYRRHQNPGAGKMYANFDCFFGMAVGLSLGLALLTRTD